MLPGLERLRKTWSFERVRKARKCVYSTLFTLYVLERQPRSKPKLPLVGFVIGKKTEAKATERNRAKRRVREAYRLCREDLLSGGDEEQIKDLKQFYALVWQIKSEVLTAPFTEIQSEVKELLRKAAEKYGRKGLKSGS